jgi:hypothetical protein
VETIQLSQQETVALLKLFAKVKGTAGTTNTGGTTGNAGITGTAGKDTPSELQKEAANKFQNLMAGKIDGQLNSQLEKLLGNTPAADYLAKKLLGDKNIGQNIMKETSKGLAKLTGLDSTKLMGSLGGAFSAYQSGNPLQGAIEGFATGGPLGAALGLIGGIFGSKKQDKWQRHEFQKAEKAKDNFFWAGFDRGEKDDFAMPEESYFRGGGGSSQVKIYLGNESINNHIVNTMTSTYSGQMLRGVVYS